MSDNQRVELKCPYCNHEFTEEVVVTPVIRKIPVIRGRITEDKAKEEHRFTCPKCQNKFTPEIGGSMSDKEKEFWRGFRESLISDSLPILDERAKWMVTTTAVMTIADSTLTQVLSRITIVNIMPSTFFALSTFFFILSLFPRKYETTPGELKNLQETYVEMVNRKLRFHRLAFTLFFLGLVFVVISALFPTPN